MTSDSEPVRQNNHAADTDNKADIQTDERKPDVPVTLGIPTTPPTKTHCEITCKIEKGFWDHVKTGAEIFGIVLLAIYTAYTIKMYCVNKITATAAKSAADTARDTLVAANRPWIGIRDPFKRMRIEFVPNKVNPNASDPISINSEITYVLENVGNAPARKVRGWYIRIRL
jgi:hypothetical protein